MLFFHVVLYIIFILYSKCNNSPAKFVCKDQAKITHNFIHPYTMWRKKIFLMAHDRRRRAGVSAAHLNRTNPCTKISCCCTVNHIVQPTSAFCVVGAEYARKKMATFNCIKQPNARAQSNMLVWFAVCERWAGGWFCQASLRFDRTPTGSQCCAVRFVHVRERVH